MAECRRPLGVRPKYPAWKVSAASHWVRLKAHEPVPQTWDANRHGSGMEIVDEQAHEDGIGAKLTGLGLLDTGEPE